MSAGNVSNDTRLGRKKKPASLIRTWLFSARLMMRSGVERLPRLVFDTSAYSWFRRGGSEVLDLASRAGVVIVPVTVLGELEAGFQGGTRWKENHHLLQEFLEEPFVVVLDTTPAVAQRYGEIVGALRKAGTPIPTNDIWIAAATFDCAGHLLTFDEHYSSVDGLPATILRP